MQNSKFIQNFSYPEKIGQSHNNKAISMKDELRFNHLGLFSLLKMFIKQCIDAEIYTSLRTSGRYGSGLRLSSSEL